MEKKIFRVLLIEDDPMVQHVNKQFIEKVPGFEVVAMASDGREGVRMIETCTPDLVILDVFMPKQDGLEVIRQLRKEENSVDVIVITAANDKDTIQSMLHNGAIDYIIKPFKFERIRYALESYKKRHDQFQFDEQLTQQNLDRILHHFPTTEGIKKVNVEIPKGLNERTLEQIMSFLNLQTESKSAEAVADGVGLARVTARRYLEYLKEIGQIELDIKYGGVGRPINKYKLKKTNT